MIQRTDYLLHFLCGVWICYTFLSFEWYISLATVVFFALVKDVLWDKLLKKGSFEWTDILSTIASFPVVMLVEQIKSMLI